MFCKQILNDYLRQRSHQTILQEPRLKGEVKISQIRLFHGWKEVRLQRNHTIL